MGRINSEYQLHRNSASGKLVQIGKDENIMLRLQTQVLKNTEVDLCTHYLMPDRGTLGYGTQTYNSLTNNLEYLNLTINCWRPERDDYGWKLAT